MYNLVFICDDNYVMPTIVTIQSILDNLKSVNKNKYVFHICTYGLSSKNIKILDTLIKHNVNLKIHVVNPKKINSKINSINQKTHVSSAALIKFELPNIFPDLDKILYLDSDLIIKKDISDIFNYNIDNYLLGAVVEFWSIQQNYYKYNHKKEHIPFYFNSGVMLLNLNRFRIENISDKLWKVKLNQFNNKNDKKHKMMDQDTFNEVCSKRCLQLPIKYNCHTKLTNEANLNLINSTFNTNYANYTELKNDVSILHYIGKDEKPWKYSGVVCQKEWDQEYIRSYYSSQKLNRIYIKHGIKYFGPKVLRSLHDRGLINTVKYIYDKRGIINRK